MDISLSEVTADAQAYFEAVVNGVGKEKSDPLTRIGILALIEKYATEIGLIDKMGAVDRYASNKNILEELNLFDIESIGQAEDLITSTNTKFFEEYAETRDEIAPLQFIRTALVNKDPERYFT